jgi:hypothetical protein
MQYNDTTDAEVKKAQFPHNLFVAGLFMFDLLLTPAVIALKIGMLGLFIPLLCSGTLIAYIYLRSKKTTTWFVDVHWKLTFKRAQWLMIGYAISAVLIFLAWLVSLTANTPDMGRIVWTALTRIALMPTVIAVLITAVLEASAVPLAAKREVPDKLAASFPRPA